MQIELPNGRKFNFSPDGTGPAVFEADIGLANVTANVSVPMEDLLAFFGTYQEIQSDRAMAEAAAKDVVSSSNSKKVAGNSLGRCIPPEECKPGEPDEMCPACREADAEDEPEELCGYCQWAFKRLGHHSSCKHSEPSPMRTGVDWSDDPNPLPPVILSADEATPADSWIKYREQHPGGTVGGFALHVTGSQNPETD